VEHSNDRLRKGSVIRDNTLRPPWQFWVVLEISHHDVLLKRPYTNEGKSFIVFEEVSVSLASLATSRYTLQRE